MRNESLVDLSPFNESYFGDNHSPWKLLEVSPFKLILWEVISLNESFWDVIPLNESLWEVIPLFKVIPHFKVIPLFKSLLEVTLLIES